MNIQAILNKKMEELRHSDPELHALLDKILKDKSGKSDYTIDRHKLPEQDIKMILKEIQQARESG
ncbi:MAG: hypothetical protein OXI67_03775 [Candidatus Poribacteria bacterium]|nr:hypothetical protein [Candidatus Poribacteria bacterium]MDE0481681.1 hypothetical protein [Candidatus Poribacteria bacterium]